MAAELPAALRVAIDRQLQGVSRRDLAERAGRTSAAYRAGAGSAQTIRGAEDALAYALVRLPATYAACSAVFEEASALAPGFHPATVLDAGAGTGAASWAAAQAWPGVQHITWLDASPPFLSLAERLSRDADAPLREARAQRCDLVGGGPWPRADLVAASYALAEIAPPQQAAVVSALWEACEGVLALVEPGTPAGYGRVLAARDVLIAAGATVLAPCPHQLACPLAAPDWCHFVQRLPRSRDHRLAKGADAPFEDEKFSYLLASRPEIAAAPSASRVLRPPATSKPGLDLRLCGPTGLEQRFVGRRDKAAYARARRLSWGDRLEP
jgi:ribosomal protein RSM22 (predicted rRNA methylase)